MDKNLVALLGFVLMFALMMLRVPIGIAMGIAGVLGFGLLSGFAPALNLLANVPLSVVTDYNLSVIPMFILMGAFCSTAGHEQGAVRRRHGLGGAPARRAGTGSIGACAGFAAINGSSVATAATMSQVALPEMRAPATTPGCRPA
jgi:C4-dicarboxylate transporter DctM subunit